MNSSIEIKLDEVDDYEHWERSRTEDDSNICPIIMGNYVFKPTPLKPIPIQKILDTTILLLIIGLIFGHILGKLI